MNPQETIISEINSLDPSVLSESGWSNPKGYLNRVYGFLNRMAPGKVYQVADLASSETSRLFVLVVQLYQHEVKGNTVVFIKNDFKRLKKTAI